MEMTLAEFLGWEENVEYRSGGTTFKVDGNHLMDLRSNGYWEYTCCETWELIELRDAVRVKPEPKKYYLKHKFLGAERFAYLNYSHEFKDFELETKSFEDNFQTQFTEEEIKMLEDSGFSLANFEKIEVK